MGLLDAVAWPGVLCELLDWATDETREAAYHYATTGDPVLRKGLAFALLIVRTERSVWLALNRHTSLTDDKVYAVERWLTRTALAMTGLLVADVTVPTAAPADGTLWLDPDLPDLPLLPLAADLAAHCGGLRVELGDLPPCIGGVAHQQRRIVRLRPAQAAAAWPHELAHQLDPMFGQRGDGALDERFADHLAALLMSYQPGTLAGAGEHIAQALTAATPEVRTDQRDDSASTRDLPAPGFESVIAFAWLPLVAAS